MCNNRRKNILKNTAEICVFCTITVLLFFYLSNVFRPIDGYNREHILGLENFDKLDVVCIGASTEFVSWQPLRAWHEFGFTSYNYATDGLDAVNIEYMLRHAQSKVKPDLFVIDVRPFQLWDEAGGSGSLRYVVDNWSIFSIDRYRLLGQFFRRHNREEEPDYISYVFDIINYHNNREVLKSQANWSYKDEKRKIHNMGFELVEKYQYLDPPKSWNTQKEALLVKEDEETLRDLCQYCYDHEINVLFVVCPYYIEKEQQEYYNTIKKIVSQYGFDFLNTNDHYNEIGIDFREDFYNRRHPNCFGAEKLTRYLGNYLKNNYNLVDHRGNSDYEFWDSEYIRFRNEEDHTKEEIRHIKDNDISGFDLVDRIKNISDLTDWYVFTNSERYTLFIYDNRSKINEDGKDFQIETVCDHWGLKYSIPASKDRNCCIISGYEKVDWSMISDDMELEGAVGKDSPTNGIKYSVSKNSIIIEGKEYFQNTDGIIVVAVDNNLCLIADSIIIKDDFTRQRANIIHVG